MGLRRIIITALTGFVFLASCNIEEYTDTRLRPGINKELQDDLLRQMTLDIFYQDSVLRVIHAELDRIDIMYIHYEHDFEQGLNQINQANVILTRIRQLNDLLENVRDEFNKSSLENKGLMEMIARLKSDLLAKEKKIRELQNTLNIQEEIIRQNEQTINLLEIANDRQKEELIRIDKELQEMKATAYMQLADLLLQIASEVPEVRGLFARRTREDVEQLQQKLISDAYSYYNKAAVSGDSYSRQRASELKSQYSFLK